MALGGHPVWLGMPRRSQMIKKSPHSPGRVWAKKSRTIDYWSVRLSSKPKVWQFDRVVVCKWSIGVAVKRVACRNEAIRGHFTCHPRAASPRDSEAISWNPQSRGLTRGLCWRVMGRPAMTLPSELRKRLSESLWRQFPLVVWGGGSV